MADSGLSSASTTSTSCGGSTAGMTIDQMHGLLKEFRAVYESQLRRLDEAEPCEDTQKVVDLNCTFDRCYMYDHEFVIACDSRRRLAITVAFLLARVIIDVIRLHSAMITATVIAADCSQMTSVITLTLTLNLNPNPNPSIVEGIPVILTKNIYST